MCFSWALVSQVKDFSEGEQQRSSCLFLHSVGKEYGRKPVSILKKKKRLEYYCMAQLSEEMCEACFCPHHRAAWDNRWFWGTTLETRENRKISISLSGQHVWYQKHRYQSHAYRSSSGKWRFKSSLLKLKKARPSIYVVAARRVSAYIFTEEHLPQESKNLFIDYRYLSQRC